MGLYLIAGIFSPDTMIAMAKAAFGLGFVIFVHELGHFFVAKACGVKCEKFYVGFDVPIKIGPFQLPAALYKKQVGETEYGIGTIPLGGYVKMLGQSDNPGAAEEEAERIKVTNEDGTRVLDPRSYPAKTVPQRMAIISAGVIMNLIFAVIFAAIAYQMGVKYGPCIAGATRPGDAAWRAGIQPGDKMIQLGRDGRSSEHLRFLRDLRYKVFMTDNGGEFDINLRDRDGDERWVTVSTKSREDEYDGMPTIGVIMNYSNRFFRYPYAIDGSVAAQSDLQNDDEIVEVSSLGETITPTDSAEIVRFLTKHRDHPVTLLVKRPASGDSAGAPSELEIALQPQPFRSLGLEFEIGPVQSIQSGAPAEGALQVGDRILAINGQPLNDPFAIDDVLGKLTGATVELTVEREDRQVTVSVRPREAEFFGECGVAGGPMSAETLGAAFTVRDSVSRVVRQDVDVQPGDIIKKVEFERTPSADITDTVFKGLKLNQAVEFHNGGENMAWVHSVLQRNPADLKVKLTLERNGQRVTTGLDVVPAEAAFNPRRGIHFGHLSDVHTASSFGEACRLGLRETKEAVGQVVMTLKNIHKLYKNLGGPGTIAYAATAEASQGWPRLLVFLTLLSANLAVLNFLPIPVLDGGHMMFLLYEGIFGKPVNERIAFGLTMLGLSFILCLMVFVIGMDVVRFTGLQG